MAWVNKDCIKKPKLVEGLASYMYENFRESQILFISAKVLDSPYIDIVNKSRNTLNDK